MTEVTMKLDITRKLEILANLKPGEMWPDELGGSAFNYAPAISEICAEALAEIQRLRCLAGQCEGHTEPAVMTFYSQPTWQPPIPPDASKYWYTVETKPEPAPEPWGSPFAMDTRNWK